MARFGSRLHIPSSVRTILDLSKMAQDNGPYTAYMGASIPQNRPKYSMVLIIGTTKMGPLIFGNCLYLPILSLLDYWAIILGAPLEVQDIPK